jgi:predicted esterase
MKSLLCFVLMGLFFCADAQTTVKGKSFRIGSHYSMFPDSLRNKEPRVYEGKTYSTTEHYSDSSAFIFVPDYFDKNKPYQFVVYFHGWGNNIDTALPFYHLQEQFYVAHLNAIFLFPEGPKNSPDSYGGKFEKADTFNYFMNDMAKYLEKEKCINKNIPFEMIYAGHSGAYRVMSYLLLHSKYNCKAILLFDALYGQQEKYAVYLQQHLNCKMINIYTDNGGTMQNSIDFANNMKAWKWKYVLKEEDDFSKSDLKQNRIIFLHSKMQHNDLVTHENNFQRFLDAVK